MAISAAASSVHSRAPASQPKAALISASKFEESVVLRSGAQDRLFIRYATSRIALPTKAHAIGIILGPEILWFAQRRPQIGRI